MIIIIILLISYNYLLDSKIIYKSQQMSMRFFGTWLLRISNDNKLINSFSYIDIKIDNLIKIKTIKCGIINTKVSRTGYIEFIKNKKTFITNIFNYYDDDLDIKLIINNVNIYSYSILGLEIPQIKYYQVPNYNLTKNLNIKHKRDTLYITDTDTNNFYIFDLNKTIKFSKLPFIELSITTLILTKIFDLIINSILK